MRITNIESIGRGAHIRCSHEWLDLNSQVIEAIRLIDWPHGSGSFTIQPSKKGNGVVPIKAPLIAYLKNLFWIAEAPVNLPDGVLHPGDFDLLKRCSLGNIIIEWETGNISSSHRSINKILATLGNYIVGAYLILPDKELAKYLTDRIGNYQELMPYFEHFRKCCPDFPFDIISVTYDDISNVSPLIPKGTDGRARG